MLGTFCGDQQAAAARLDLRAMQKSVLSAFKPGMTVVAVVDKVLPSSLIVVIQRMSGSCDSHHVLSSETLLQRTWLLICGG